MRGPPARMVLSKPAAKVTQGAISICRGNPCACPIPLFLIFHSLSPLFPFYGCDSIFVAIDRNGWVYYSPKLRQQLKV